MALVMEAIHANKGCHIVKTIVGISDDLFARAQRLARKEKTTFRALTEAGLRLGIFGKHSPGGKKLPPLVSLGRRRPDRGVQGWELGPNP